MAPECKTLGKLLFSSDYWFNTIRRGVGPGRALLSGLQKVFGDIDPSHYLFEEACDHAHDQCVACKGPTRPGAVLLWFRTTGHNWAVNRSRRLKHRAGWSDVERRPSEHNLERRLAAKEAVNKGLKHKSATTQYVLRAKELLGFTRSEIATQLDLKTHQIDYMLGKARSNIRKVYQE